jgi:hypothetical protein
MPVRVTPGHTNREYPFPSAETALIPEFVFRNTSAPPYPRGYPQQTLPSTPTYPVLPAHIPRYTLPTRYPAYPRHTPGGTPQTPGQTACRPTRTPTLLGVPPLLANTPNTYPDLRLYTEAGFGGGGVYSDNPRSAGVYAGLLIIAVMVSKHPSKHGLTCENRLKPAPGIRFG